MKRTQSISFRLSASFGLLFVVVTAVGVFGLERLNEFDRESNALRDHWLQSTRYLGDLSNYTSDFRMAEGTFLLARNEIDASSSRKELAKLEEEVSRAQRGYERLSHDSFEQARYDEFQREWEKYRRFSARVISSGTGEDRAQAIDFYMATTRASFQSISDILETLTERNNQLAQQASAYAIGTSRSARLLMGVAIASGGLIVLAIMAYVTREVTAPLAELAKAMSLLSDNATHVEIIGADRTDELGEMASAVLVFRANAIELKINQQGLANQASMLEEKLAQERRLSENQRNFISMASHEFRTPMNVIDGHAQRLINARGSLSPDVIHDRARKIRIAIKRMSTMIESLLQSSKLTEADPSLYFHPCDFDLRGLLREVCSLHREISPNAAVVENLGDASLQIRGDKHLLFQAFGNLVANAIKYSPGMCAVNIGAKIEGSALVVSIKDHGIGIPQKDIHKLFDRYFRGSNVTSIVGTGIGLYLVKIVLELHGGSITVESRENHGSCFNVTLPFSSVIQS